MKYRPLPTGARKAAVLELVTLLTACAVTLTVGSVLEGFLPVDTAWFLLAAVVAAAVGLLAGLALDTAASTVFYRQSVDGITGHPAKPGETPNREGIPAGPAPASKPTSTA